MPTPRYRLPLKRRFQPARLPLEKLVSLMAEKRMSLPGGGGNWSGHSGDGTAWHKDGDRHWSRKRDVRGGKWSGPWRRVRAGDMG